MANVTVEIPESLSNLQGAYDRAHWQVEVCPVKAGATLKRGFVVARPAADAGAVSLVIGTTQADAFGIVLDAKADASAAAATCSVAKAGSFRGPALIVGSGTDEAALVKQLRLAGIFIEGVIPAVTLMEAKAEDESARRRPEDERPVASAESMERRRREEDEERRRRQGHKS